MVQREMISLLAHRNSCATIRHILDADQKVVPAQLLALLIQATTGRLVDNINFHDDQSSLMKL